MSDDEPQGSADEQRDAAADGPVDDDARDPRGRFGPGNPFRFPPGQSGNPSGRSPGMKQALARIMRRLAEKVPELGAYESAGELALETLIVEMRRRDSRGRVQAARDIADREFGRVPVSLVGAIDNSDGPRDIRIRVVGPDDVDREALRAPAKRLTGGGNGNGNGSGTDAA